MIESIKRSASQVGQSSNLYVASAGSYNVATNIEHSFLESGAEVCQVSTVFTRFTKIEQYEVNDRKEDQFWSQRLIGYVKTICKLIIKNHPRPSAEGMPGSPSLMPNLLTTTQSQDQMESALLLNVVI